ncbi:heme ABC transporter [Bacillaceae bacterium JMAK1]|nr:heme ABC transporter [Bacillaceae bacterium JMAK1]
MSNQRKNLVEIWEDHVHIKDLIVAVLLCAVPALGGYMLAPSEPPMPLAIGLVSAFVGFIIACIVIKPKRHLEEIDEE